MRARTEERGEMKRNDTVSWQQAYNAWERDEAGKLHLVADGEQRAFMKKLEPEVREMLRHERPSGERENKFHDERSRDEEFAARELGRGTSRESIVRFIASERSLKPGSKPYPREYAERLVERVQSRKLEHGR
jgi:hypothetical protein